jgi:hypothetical protein
MARQLDTVVYTFASSETIDLTALILASNAGLADVDGGWFYIEVDNTGTDTAYVNSPDETDAVTSVHAYAGGSLSAGPYEWNVGKPVQLYGLVGADVVVTPIWRL